MAVVILGLVVDLALHFYLAGKPMNNLLIKKEKKMTAVQCDVFAWFGIIFWSVLCLRLLANCDDVESAFFF